MGASSRPAKPGGRRPKRDIQLPQRYSREYPVNDGHDYRVRGIPDAIWTKARSRSLAEHRSIRLVIIRSLELYASGRLKLDT